VIITLLASLLYFIFSGVTMAPLAALEQASKLGMELLDDGGRQLFGISREADWVVGGAAFGFAAGIIQLLANRALEVNNWV
jgi:hypothetical protein